MSSKQNETNSVEKQQKDARREEVKQVLTEGCTWMTKTTVDMVVEKSSQKMNQVLYKTRGRVPNPEIKFKVFDVQSEFLKYSGALTENNEKKVYNPTIFPFYSKRGEKKVGFSFITIWNREFISTVTTTDINGNKTDVKRGDNRPFQRAGIKTRLVLDVKQALNPMGIKVFDVSDSNMSKKTVWEITMFPLEENFKKSFPDVVSNYKSNSPRSDYNSTSHHSRHSRQSHHSHSYKKKDPPSTPEFKNDMMDDPVVPTGPVKDGFWVKAVKGTLDEVKQNLEEKLEAVSTIVEPSISEEKEHASEENDPAIEEQITSE